MTRHVRPRYDTDIIDNIAEQQTNWGHVYNVHSVRRNGNTAIYSINYTYMTRLLFREHSPKQYVSKNNTNK